MKILIVGGNGTIGRAVVKELQKKHEVLVAGRTKGDVLVDISKPETIEKMYQTVGTVDAVICAAGSVGKGYFRDMSEADYYIGIQNKLMGQVNLVRIGKEYLTRGGSFTLITGILADDPVPKTSGSALANGAINSWAKAVAMEEQGNFRINVVAPGLVEDSAERLSAAFPGHVPITMQQAVSGFVKSVEGLVNGEVIRIY